MENFFISWAFILTCLVSLTLYYLPVCRPLQMPILVIISLFIYWLAAGNLIFLLLFCCLNTAFFSHTMTYMTRWRRPLIIAGVSINCSLLLFFKYKTLLLPAPLIAGWFGSDPVWLNIYTLVLPIGISFYVFHSISLMVDSYKKPELISQNLPQHVLKTTLYLTFFPQIVAGPIAKGHFFYPQIIPKRFADIDWTSALRALVHGYFLKEIIANNLNQLTAPMGHPDMWPLTHSSELLWMMLGYSAQIFADFAGYSLIAIGLGRLYGYELPLNFNSPYFAHSFADFWKRWHISLSSWLRDYLYIPLGGNQKGVFRTYCNLMIVMALGGLWHGPEWKYALWGIIHGVALVLERPFTRSDTPTLLRPLRIAFVFSCVTIAWLFFRLNSVQEVSTYISSIATWHKGSIPYHTSNMILLYLFTGSIFAYHCVSTFHTSRYLTLVKRYDGYLVGAMVVLCLIARGPESAFIYFQF